MKIGAHISTQGGLHTAFDRAAAIGAECVQVFESAPQQWGTARLTDEQIDEFRAKAADSALTPILIHGKYLMNLASADPKIFKTSASTLRSSLNIAGRIGAVGVIFHTGSHKGMGLEAVFEQICSAARDVLAETPENTWMIFENSAGQGGTIGSKFEDLGQIIKRIDNPRAKVCIDTCHAFASGYDLSNKAGVEAMVMELDTHVGLANVAAIHCNDSKTDLGAGRDLHENIGEGKIGRAGFEAIVAHKAFANVPLILEVPGYKLDGAPKGPDKPNIDLLKEIRTAARVKP
jgi:deoxyribonuclease-4